MNFDLPQKKRPASKTVLFGILIPIYIIYIIHIAFQISGWLLLLEFIQLSTKRKVISDMRFSCLPAGIAYNLRAECEDHMPTIAELIPVLANILEQDTDALLRQVAALISAMSVIPLTSFRLTFNHIINKRHPFGLFHLYFGLCFIASIHVIN